MRSPRLLLYVARAADEQRVPVATTLAALAERAGWEFDLYVSELRRGRHFGGGDPEQARTGVPAGSLVAGGAHVEQVLWLAAHYEVLAAGDAGSPLWPALDGVGVTVLTRSADPAELYAAAFEAAGEPVPQVARVLDSRPQGHGGTVVAPYLYPLLLAAAPSVAIDVSSSRELRERVSRLGPTRFEPLGVDPARREGFPGGLAGADPVEPDQDYAALTATLAERAAGWGRGVLLADPGLAAAQLAKARRLRLLPLYGQPQTEVIARSSALLRRAREPVFGRQYDDHDFVELARHGRGLQVLDPSPPFDAAHALPAAVHAPETSPRSHEPDDAQLERWADEGRVLTTLLLWSGMLRELDCIPRLLDLVAETGLRAGLVITAETVEQGARPPLSLLGVPPEAGGVLGLVEPLLGSTGRGVAAESQMPPGTLAASLGEAVTAIARRLPEGLRPHGWWPLLDTPLVPHRDRRVGLRGRRPVVRFSPRGSSGPAPSGADDDRAPGPAPGDGAGRTDLRALAGRTVRRTGLDRLLEERRPFDRRRPGALDHAVVEAVRGAGLDYMFTKANFGSPRLAHRDGAFVVLPSTAGRWDGWSPFYTLGQAQDLAAAERRLGRDGRPGWLVSTIDGPLFALSGEVWEHGSTLHEIAALAAAGGRSGRLVNTTPHVVARYARLLDERGAGGSSAAWQEGSRPGSERRALG